MIYAITFLLIDKMPYRGVCSFDDLDILLNEYSDLNKNIINPTEQEFKKFWGDALKKLGGIERCHAIYSSGKHKGERCRASPQPDSNYCLKHATQEPGYKEAMEQARKSLKKTNLNDQ
jgi:hypothetical protein